MPKTERVSEEAKEVVAVIVDEFRQFVSMGGDPDVKAVTDSILEAVLPALRAQWEQETRKKLNDLYFGPGPDRDVRYQGAWRAGVSDATDAVLGASS